MPDPPDNDLLNAFVNEGSRDALARLVARYVDFVHNAARRQVRDPHLAEDVTQAVFVTLVERAGTIRGGDALPGWLFNTARYCAANATRAETRRHKRERAVARPEQGVSHESSAASVVEPMLDDAIGHLGEAERTAVLMRYFQGRDVGSVATALGVSTEAAQKRITRAVAKLRRFFAQKGVAMSAAGVVAVLAPSVSDSASAGLTASATAAALGQSTKGRLIAEEAMRVMLQAKLKFAASILGGLLATGSIAALAGSSLLVTTTPATMPSTAPAVATLPAIAIDDLLNRLEASTAWQKHVAMTVAINAHSKYPENEKPFRGVEKYDLLRDGDRMVARGSYADAETPDKSRGKTQIGIDGERTFRVQAYASEAEPISLSISLNAKELESGKKQFRAILADAGGLDGYTTSWGDRSLADWLRQGHPALVPEEVIEGRPCYVVESVAPIGKLTVWIDPARGFNALKRVLVIGPTDKLGTETLEKATHKGVKYISCTAVMDHTQFRKEPSPDGKVYVRVACRQAETSVLADGTQIVRTSEYQRIKIDLHPAVDDPKAFLPDVPDGTPVHINGGRTNGLEWRDGQIAPGPAKL